MFISFEGIEGSGKSTLLEAVARHVRSRGSDPLLLREPGGSDVGEAVRDIFLRHGPPIDPLVEAFLMNASRAQLVRESIRPALAAGRIVLCDRYLDSSLAYQGYGRGLDVTLVRTLCDAATGGLYPDRTLLVDVSPETSRARVSSRGATDRMDAQTLEFYRRAREGFLALARAEPHRFCVLDGERSEAEVLSSALEAIGPLAA